MNLHNDQPERPDEVGPVENLLNRRMAKAVSMMGLPPRDAENVCTRCGAPAVHCQCIGADASDHRGALPMSGEIGYPCGHESHSGIGDDLWKCDICGEVVRYVDDPDGDIWMTTLHPYANRKVRTEVVTPGDGRRMDAAGAPVAPCSGRHHNNWCTTCGHDPSDHNEELICLVCHQLCDYCGTFRDQHTDTEWTSCQRDLLPHGRHGRTER